jgi:hypothetical protein
VPRTGRDVGRVGHNRGCGRIVIALVPNARRSVLVREPGRGRVPENALAPRQFLHLAKAENLSVFELRSAHCGELMPTVKRRDGFHDHFAGHLWLGEIVATAGLILRRSSACFDLVAVTSRRIAVASFIGATSWFTSTGPSTTQPARQLSRSAPSGTRSNDASARSSMKSHNRRLIQ